MDREHLQTENRSEVGGVVPAVNPRPTRLSQEGLKLEASGKMRWGRESRAERLKVGSSLRPAVQFTALNIETGEGK